MPDPAAGRTPGRGYPAAALALAGVCFAMYTAIRPFSDESTLRGAQAFASASWQVARTLAMVAFILLTFGLCGPDARLRGSRAGGRARAGLVLTAAGTGLTLPYYDAENFGPQPARVTLYGDTQRSSASRIATTL